MACNLQTKEVVLYDPLISVSNVLMDSDLRMTVEMCRLIASFERPCRITGNIFTSHVSHDWLCFGCLHNLPKEDAWTNFSLSVGKGQLEFEFCSDCVLLLDMIVEERLKAGVVFMIDADHMLFIFTSHQFATLLVGIDFSVKVDEKTLIVQHVSSVGIVSKNTSSTFNELVSCVDSNIRTRLIDSAVHLLQAGPLGLYFSIKGIQLNKLVVGPDVKMTLEPTVKNDLT